MNANRNESIGNNGFGRRGAWRQAVAAGFLAAGGALAQVGGFGPEMSEHERAEWRAGRIEALTEIALGPGGQDASLRCVSLGDCSILFAPGATRDDVTAVLADATNPQLAMFQLQGSRWTVTATDGAVAIGQPMTLTYSFVPDGVFINSFGAGDAANSDLQARADAVFPGGMAAFKARVRQALEDWGARTNITYVEVSDDGAAFQTSPGLSGGRGDIRIAGRPIGGNILAVNFYPQFGGDMVIDTTKFDTFNNPVNDFVALRNVIAHEHGHGLGMQHVDPVNQTKLMESSLSTNFDGPQEDDWRGAYYLYGDQYESNDTLATAFFVGGPLNSPSTNGVQVFTIEEAALERGGAKDFFAFTAFAGVPIALRVEPLGTSYEAGPQNGTTQTVDAQAARNLGLRLWRRVSAQTGEFSLLAQIDFNAAGQAEYHPPITYTLAGYMVAEIYSNDGVDDVQRYRLRISNATIDPTVEPPTMTVFDISAGQQINDGSTLQFGSVNIGQSGSKSLTIVNGGPGVLELGTITLQGPGAGDYAFNLIGNPTIPANSSASLGISFIPTTSGGRVAVMTIPNNDPDQPNFSFIVSGQGVVPPAPAMEVRFDGSLTASGAVVDFGDAPVDAEVTLPIQIRNTGNAQLNVTSLSISGLDAGRFTTSLNSASLAPGGSVDGQVRFTPSSQDDFAAELTIQNNASTYAVTLFGTGFNDCNGNGIPDDQDIASGTSQDCNGNGVPDECELDSDGNGIIDDCEEPADDQDGDQNGQDADDEGDADDNANDDDANDDADEDNAGADDDEILDDAGDDAGQDDVNDDNDNQADDDDNQDNNNQDNNNNNNNQGNNNQNGQDHVGGNQLDDVDGDADQDDDFEPVRPVGLCGFGFWFASLASMLSMSAMRARRRQSRIG